MTEADNRERQICKAWAGEADRADKLEALCRTLAQALARTNQYLRIRIRPLKPYTQERRVDVLMDENESALDAAKKLLVEVKP